jgi:hypothetical protein
MRHNFLLIACHILWPPHMGKGLPRERAEIKESISKERDKAGEREETEKDVWWIWKR